MEARRLRNATIVALPFFALISAGVLDAQQPAAPPTPLVRSPGNAEWADSSESARSRAAAEGKFVFYEFDRPKCGTCTRMDALLYPAFEFEALLAQMVPVKLSLESAEGGKLALHFGITDTPAVLVTTPEGRLVFQMSGFSSAEDFYSHIHADLDSYRKFARKVAAQEIGKLGAREAYDTGVALYQRSDPGAALPRLKRAISAPDATASIRDDARELLAAVELDLGQTAASRDDRTSSLDHARPPPPAEGGALPRPTPARREQARRGPGAVSEVSEGPSRLPLSQAGLGDGRENVGRVLPKMRRAAPFLLLEI